MTKLNDYTDILLEEIRDQLQAVVELVGHMQENIKLRASSADLEEVKNNVKVIKKVITDISRQQKDHKNSITKLESVRAS